MSDVDERTARHIKGLLKAAQEVPPEGRHAVLTMLRHGIALLQAVEDQLKKDVTP